jgi:GNAT superfamily N-acetyltransferase
MQENNHYLIRTMTRKELDLATDWAAAEGWNPGLHDADCFYKADPTGFLIGLFENEPIAAISAVKYGDSFGFICFYIVKPAYRGKGFGIQIWKAGIEHLKGCNIGLDGVVAQQDNYKKSGFNLAHRNIRFEGVGGGDLPCHSDIVPLSTIPFDDVNAYDEPFFPDKRTQFLKCWINQSESTALGIMKNGKLAGYGVLRVCRFGYKVGPLFADTAELADTLFLALRASAKEGTPIYLDTPEPNHAAVALARRNNMKSVFETARMYTGEIPTLPLDRLFGETF